MAVRRTALIVIVAVAAALGAALWAARVVGPRPGVKQALGSGTRGVSY